MVRLIMGLKGSGKTKKLVDLVCKAVDEGSGDVVVVENERSLTYDIPYRARLVDAASYNICSFELLKGFLSGIHAGNYDITHFFIDNYYKIVGDKSDEVLIKFVEWLNRFSAAENVEFFISISADPEAVPEVLKPYIM